MRQLTGLDAQFLALESPRQAGHVGALAVLDPSTRPNGQLELADLLNMIDERLPLLPPFRWRLKPVPFNLDYPYWIEDPDFDLEYHVRETALAPPPTDAKLAEQVARIFERPLDRARPLWEAYLIHGLQDENVGLLTKIHHSVVDGVSGAEIMGVLLDLTPEGREPPPPADSKPENEPSELSMLARGLLGTPRYVERVARSLPSTLPNLEDAPILNEIPGAKTLGARVVAVRAGAAWPRVACARAQHPESPTHLLQRARVGAPALRLRAALAGRRQGNQERLRLHGQRCRRRPVRRRRAPVARRAR